ncbi:helix-turn-helix transcriptional regulator [Dyadobacter sediminis]|uniref:Helix-turn-helix transcriptional regulator n=1 Tax=Dyadobacter sediminis TaxID=1493691 RepID=A0A5R9KJ39_9BACT|nr:helix-turn-helix transcriptional regulator [Dyadobacter sediminis]TLU96225.1 helix-turn-helix transcriptional regulator [Dyadobacter sediminis]GGB80356.1 transcriptional regulator [Dyadobacter sediminis]
MDLNEKIKQILIEKNISPSLFADEIGIQRSSISHILAGRNKPSLDIVQKIIRRFPEIGLNWIMDDESLPLDQTEYQERHTSYAPVHERKPQYPAASESSRKYNHQTARSRENGMLNDAVSKQDKTVERILIFYSNGTFQEFRQGV